jgi:hypothetical protein
MILKRNISLSWKRVNRLKIYAVLFTVLFHVLSVAPSVQAGPGTVMYFYHPDANLRDVAQLKSQVQEYFRSIDSKIQLTAFLKLQDLEKAIRSKPPDILLASSWVSKTTGSQHGYKPLLVGQVGTNRSYKKVLISKKALPPSGSPSLSMVGLGQQNLKQLVPKLRKYAHLNVIEVSKDLDAVLAVSFGQVDLGLVRSQNIEAIRKVNAMAVKGIQVLAQSAPIEYPIISASPKLEQPVIDKFVQVLPTIKDAKSAQALDLMGFESWGKM